MTKFANSTVSTILEQLNVRTELESLINAVYQPEIDDCSAKSVNQRREARKLAREMTTIKSV